MYTSGSLRISRMALLVNGAPEEVCDIGGTGMKPGKELKEEVQPLWAFIHSPPDSGRSHCSK